MKSTGESPRTFESRNMRAGVTHGAFFRMATAFADPYAVVPLFFAGFTDSRALIGLVVSLMEAMIIVPQIAVSRHLRRKPLGNKSGTRAVILSGLSLAVAGLAILLVSRSAAAFILAFAFAGGAMSATVVGYSGYILELGTPEIRPFLFALEGVLLFPLYFAPLLGGLIADFGGYQSVLLAGVGLLGVALILAVTLCEPRRHSGRCGNLPLHTELHRK